mgnify:CR=1 FL=1
MTESNVIEINHLTKEFVLKIKKPGFLNGIKSIVRAEKKKVKAVNAISFTVKKGEIIGFIGPNGAGKSTTIKMMTGILFPTKGSISVLGYNPQEQRKELAYHIGTVFGQKPQLWQHLPPIDTFYLFAQIYEVDKADFERRLHKLIELFDIQDFLYTPVRKLSLGQRMRCEIVAALLHNPEVIFLDEPTIGLDIIAKKKIRELLKKLNEEEGTTIILTSHDMEDIEKICKRIIIINKGCIVFDGSIEKVKRLMKNKIVSLYFNDKIADIIIPKGVKVIEKSVFKVALEVDTSKVSITKLLNFFFTKYEIADIVIKEIPIEEIIEDIYKR